MLTKRIIYTFILIIIFISSKVFSSEKDSLLFSIDEKLFTTIDLEKRILYLDLFEIISKKPSTIERNPYIDDLISISLFDEFAKRKKIIIEKQLIDKYYDQIINNFERQNQISFHESEHFINIDKETILKNIKFDLQRKKILELLLKQNNKDYSSIKNQNDILKIFKINFIYLIIENKFKEKYKSLDIKINNKKINEIREILNKNDINYNFYQKEIINLDKIDSQIKLRVEENINEFEIFNESYFLIGKIDKNIKKNIDLKYTFFQIFTEKSKKNDPSFEKINCQNINNEKIQNVYKIKKYENYSVEKLNISILENLINKNDKVMINNNDQNYLLLLCNINYNNEMAVNLSINENMQEDANVIESEFIKYQKREYNFKIYN